MAKKRKSDTSDQPESSQPRQTEATGPRKVVVPKKSVASLTMKTETHPWLKWPGCTPARKIELNNRLAEMQGRRICAPRFLDGDVVDKLGLKHQLEKMFLTRIEDNRGVFETPIWSRALNVAHEVYKEWCLEFYSSLRVDKEFVEHEFYSKKLIHFRLGGKEHSISIAEFGFLTGLLTEAESKHARISSYLLSGELSSKDFGPEANNAWMELTRLPEFKSKSKVSAIRDPLLRLVHKLLVYSFIHRLTQHDKCYVDDLWLIYKLSKRDPGEFVCVPWVLVCFMEAKGAGKVKDSQICCGHFVTRIAKNLNLYTQTNIKLCAPPVEFKRVTMRDLEIMKLLNAAGTELLEVESDDEESEMRVPEVPARRAKKGKSTIMEELQKLYQGNREIRRVCAKTQRMVSSLSERIEYHIERYQPVLEKMAAADAAADSRSLAPYAPPPPFAQKSAAESETSGSEESDETDTAEDEED